MRDCIQVARKGDLSSLRSRRGASAAVMGTVRRVPNVEVVTNVYRATRLIAVTAKHAVLETSAPQAAVAYRKMQLIAVREGSAIRDWRVSEERNA
jgi:hypothetical protein